MYKKVAFYIFYFDFLGLLGSSIRNMFVVKFSLLKGFFNINLLQRIIDRLSRIICLSSIKNVAMRFRQKPYKKETNSYYSLKYLNILRKTIAIIDIIFVEYKQCKN